MATDTSSFPGAEAFTAFWSDWMAKAGKSGAGNEMAESMRKAFFDAMSKSAEEYMRSEAFLTAMKQSMDHALNWQQALNQYFQKGLGAAQMPTRGDADQIVALVRGAEERLAAKLDEISRRIDKLEKPQRSTPAASTQRKKQRV